MLELGQLDALLLDAGELRTRLTAVDKALAFVQATVTPLPLLERLLGLDRASARLDGSGRVD